MPDTISFTEEDLRSAVERSGGESALASFDDLRGILDEDWTYNQDDLRADLSNDDVIDETRDFLADGYAHPKDDPDDFGEALDEARQSLGEFMTFGWVAYIIAPLLLVILGALGGGRLAGQGRVGRIRPLHRGGARLHPLVAGLRRGRRSGLRRGARRDHWKRLPGTSPERPSS